MSKVVIPESKTFHLFIEIEDDVSLKSATIDYFEKLLSMQRRGLQRSSHLCIGRSHANKISKSHAFEKYTPISHKLDWFTFWPHSSVSGNSSSKRYQINLCLNMWGKGWLHWDKKEIQINTCYIYISTYTGCPVWNLGNC